MSERRGRRRFALLALLCCAAPAFAEETGSAKIAPGDSALEENAPGESWPEAKCRLYSEAWARAVDSRGTEGLGEDFLLEHQAFLDAGCLGPARVCPRSTEELSLADLMSVLAINEGMTGSFLPFACPR